MIQYSRVQRQIIVSDVRLYSWRRGLSHVDTLIQWAVRCQSRDDDEVKYLTNSRHALNDALTWRHSLRRSALSCRRHSLRHSSRIAPLIVGRKNLICRARPAGVFSLRQFVVVAFANPADPPRRRDASLPGGLDVLELVCPVSAWRHTWSWLTDPGS